MERTEHSNLAMGERVIYSGHTYAHAQGVAIMATRIATKAFLQWNPVTPRICIATFKVKTNEGKLTRFTTVLQQTVIMKMQCTMHWMTPMRDSINANVGSKTQTKMGNMES